MYSNLDTFILLPVGLGLLGFIEPCTIGTHLLFMGTQQSRSIHEKIAAVLIFMSSRIMVMGLIGALMASAGQFLIDVQTKVWLVFGSVYLIIGLSYLVGQISSLKKQVNLAPIAWKQSNNPVVLGLVFGLNIPACAAPIMFGLLSFTATVGTFVSGFLMMGLFALALTFPLILFLAIPHLALRLEVLGQKMKQTRWLIGGIFIVLGIWSVWFGLFVNPADWSGL